MARPSYDVIVVGTGLHGLSCALNLAREGLKVVALDKDHPGRHASGVNAGGVRRLGRHEAELPLSVAALEIWHRIEQEVGDSCGFVACDQIKVAENLSQAEALQARVQRLRQLGYDHEQWIDEDELKRRVPAVAGHCVGALLCAGDGSANPFRTVMAFRRAALSAGVEIRENCPVQALRAAGSGWRVDTPDGPVDGGAVVNCAGAWGNNIARALGEPVPVTAAALMLMITERLAPFLSPVLGAAGRTLSFKQFDNGTLLIGGGHRGTAQPECNRSRVRFAGLRISAQTVGALFPQLADVRVVRSWAGLEGMMPDHIPVIGPSGRAEGVYHAFGFCGHGFQLAPITGRIMADLLVRGQSSLPIEAFRIQRFAGIADTAAVDTPEQRISA